MKIATLFTILSVCVLIYVARSQPTVVEQVEDPKLSSAGAGSGVDVEAEKCENCEPAAGADVASSPSVTVSSIMEKFEGLILTDQHGNRVRLVDDVLAGKTVAVNFIFTTCKTICPPMGANFGNLSALIDEKKLEGVSLVSISLDPVTDTPGRLKAWADKFGARENWALLTGSKHEIDSVLKALKVFSADITAHAPFILIGDTANDEWVRLNGFTAPEEVAAALVRGAEKPTSTPPSADTALELQDPSDASDSPEAPKPSDAAREYFSDVELTDHLGKKHRFYTDLIHGKTVVTHSFFATCKGACPVLMEKILDVQQDFADRMGNDLFILSISVDPGNDTPEVLAEYAKKLGAGPGWFFLTGPKKNVDWALYKIGHYTEAKEGHSNIIAVGNDKSGLWKKAFGLDPQLDLPKVVEEVLNDEG